MTDCRSILVTGATGFLGSNVCRMLACQKHRIYAALRPTSDRSRLAAFQDSLTIVNSDPESIASFFADRRPLDGVFHAATCYGRKGEDDDTIEKTNILWPLEIMRAAAKSGARFFLNVDTTLPPSLNKYAATKHAFCIQAREEAAKLGIVFANARMEYVYGPFDDESKFPTFVIRSCLKNTPEIKLTPCEQKRDFIYIDDACAAFCAVLGELSQAASARHDFEVGSGKAVSLREFVNLVRAATDSATTFAFGALPYRAGEIMYSCADTSALSELGWKSRTDLAEGIQKTITLEAQP
jgi:nucleoside-diphosphate-sugar epimerase